MNKSALHRSAPVVRGKGQMRAGLKYVTREPRLGIPLLMMALVGTLAYEFQVSLPVLAKQTFHGGAETYGFLTAFMGAGAVIGGLVTATRGKTGLRALSIAAIVFGVAILVTAVSPVLGLAYGAMALVGWGSVSFLATGNSTLQLGSDPSMRGRVMALWAVAFLGSTPIGGPAIGWVIEQTNARVGLAIGGVSCLLAACLGFVARARLRSGRDQVPGPGEGSEVPVGPVSEVEELQAEVVGVPVPAANGLAASARVASKAAGE
jgi:MFS family permease